jgi:hypothetical protein
MKAVREGLATRFKGLPDVHYGDDRHWVSGNMAVSKWLGKTRIGRSLRNQFPNASRIKQTVRAGHIRAAGPPREAGQTVYPSNAIAGNAEDMKNAIAATTARRRTPNRYEIRR